MSSGQKKTIAIDFDGVIHSYSLGWQNGSIYDLPVFGSQTSIKKLRNKGYRIVIFTAREELENVEEWLQNNHIEFHIYFLNTLPHKT